MSKYIDAEKLREEVEFAKSVYSNPQRVVHGIADAFRQDGRAAMCDDILKKLEPLQQEQPEEPDKNLEEAAYKYSFDSRPSIYGQVDVIDAFIAGAEWMAGQGYTTTGRIIDEVAYYDIQFDELLPNNICDPKDKVIVQIRKK